MQRVAGLVIAGIALLLTVLLLAGPGMLPQVAPADEGDGTRTRSNTGGEATAGNRPVGAHGGRLRLVEKGLVRPRHIELTPDLIEVCLEVAADIDEQLAAQLREMRTENPEAFQKKLREMHRLVDLAVLKQRDPSQYSLKQLELAVNAKVNRLTGQYREAKRLGKAQEMLIAEQRLRDQVRLQVGFSLKAREDYVCRLEELALGLQRELESDRDGFDEWVEHRMRDLTRQPSPDHGGVEPSPAPAEQSDHPRPFIRPVGPAEEGGEAWSGRLERPERPSTRALDPELIETCMEVARDIDQTLAAELEKVRAEHPEQFEGRLRQTRRLIALARLKLRDPRLYSLKKQELDVDAEVSRLAGAHRAALADGDDAAAESLESQLRQYVRLQLAFSLHSRQDYVAQLEDLIQRLRGELQQEQDDFENAVARRIARLLGRPRPEPAPPDAEIADGR